MVSMKISCVGFIDQQGIKTMVIRTKKAYSEGAGLIVEVGELDTEQGSTTMAMLDGVDGRTIVVVLDGVEGKTIVVVLDGVDGMKTCGRLNS
jgi:hypothetical protein